MVEQQLQNNKGYIALILSIIVLSIGVLVTTGLILLNTSYNKNVLVLENSLNVKNVADTCFREALFEINENYEIIGEFEKEILNGSCFYSISTEGSNKIIQIKASLNNTYKTEIIKVNSDKEILFISTGD